MGDYYWTRSTQTHSLSSSRGLVRVVGWTRKCRSERTVFFQRVECQLLRGRVVINEGWASGNYALRFVDQMPTSASFSSYFVSSSVAEFRCCRNCLLSRSLLFPRRSVRSCSRTLASAPGFLCFLFPPGLCSLSTPNLLAVPEAFGILRPSSFSLERIGPVFFSYTS